MANKAQLKEYKINHGYSEDTSRTILGQSDGRSGLILGAAINNFLNKMYYISFEKDGILFILSNMFYKLKEENFFIKYSDVDITMGKQSLKNNGHSSLANDSLIIKDKKTGELLKFSIFKRSLVSGAMSDNYASIKSFVNDLNEEFNSEKNSNENTKIKTESNANFCSKCGEKLEINSRFCPNCGNKTNN